MVTRITDYFLYRWRYILGYSIISLLVVGLLLVGWLFIPGGLSEAEQQSVALASSLTFSLQTFEPSAIINLPYHLLQHLSISLLGVSTLSVKLPSFILGLFSGLGMLLLLRIWFRQNVAVLTTLLVITTGQFMFLAQSGTPAIVYVFWPVWILVSALMVSRRVAWSTLWKIALFGAAALSLYTPFALYILIALISAGILHPHLRYIFRQLSKVKLLIGSLSALILMAPLIYMITLHPSVGLQLIGIPDTWPNIGANALQLINQFGAFASPGGDRIMTPIYGLGPMILIALGLVRLFTTKYTARSYIIIAWIVLLLPVLLTNPTYMSVTFIPGILLMAMGVSLLISRWYSLFPRNPYARFAGLLPLIVLIGGMMFTGIDRYLYGYLYDPKIAVNFSNDLDLLKAQLADKNRGATSLVVAQSETAFYGAVAKYYDNVVVNPDAAQTAATPPATVIVSHNAQKDFAINNPRRIVTNSKTDDSDRFYIYKSNTE